MNEETNQLLESLATKLGTTTEYLWSILIKQAPIDSIITISMTLFTIVLWVCLYKIHKKLMGPYKESSSYSCYNHYEEGVGIPMVVGLIVLLILTIGCIISFPSAIYGFCNPEYWALKEVLNSIQGTN